VRVQTVVPGSPAREQPSQCPKGDARFPSARATERGSRGWRQVPQREGSRVRVQRVAPGSPTRRQPSKGPEGGARFPSARAAE
jgi:hypothetical protein